MTELERVPVAAGVAEIAARLKKDVYSLACAFGEGVVFLRDGEPVELSGWDHFRE